MNKLVSFALVCTILACNPQAKKQTNFGKTEIDHYENFKSAYIRPRNVDVWLPSTYLKNKQYTVLYMHDGQSIFSDQSNENRMSWKVDETIENLAKTGKIEACIIVGIWSTKDRTIEYTPNKPYQMLNDSAKNAYQMEGRITQKPKSDEYLKFIVEELKPFIDKTYSTKTDKENTFIAGASMGGLISLYALAEYPLTFGGAACISTHWPLSISHNTTEFSLSYMEYLKQNQSSFNNCRLYFDYGTESLDTMYGWHQTLIDSVFGTFSLLGHNYQSGKYKGGAHNANSWAKRFPSIAEFLLSKD